MLSLLEDFAALKSDEQRDAKKELAVEYLQKTWRLGLTDGDMRKVRMPLTSRIYYQVLTTKMDAYRELISGSKTACLRLVKENTKLELIPPLSHPAQPLEQPMLPAAMNLTSKVVPRTRTTISRIYCSPSRSMLHCFSAR